MPSQNFVFIFTFKGLELDLQSVDFTLIVATVLNMDNVNHLYFTLLKWSTLFIIAHFAKKSKSCYNKSNINIGKTADMG